MLVLNISGQEYWNEEKEQFEYGKPCTLKLEHSLISIAKWEAKWLVPFFDSEKTSEMALDYIRCMTLNTNVDEDCYSCLTYDDIEKINKYIEAPMTATTIKDDGTGKRNSERITAELIYYWMISYNIPIEFEKWHINRLIMLIRVCSEKNKPPKKMSKRDIMRQNSAINAARRARLHTKG